ncbi:MAG: MarR family winged helix-turn-helix transcriptional regulator [Trebonia sp.]
MTKQQWLTFEQERAWRAYRQMRTLLDLQLARDLQRNSGLSEPDYDVLSTLSESPSGSWRAREFAARLRWSTSRLAHQIGRMQRRGLVQRSSTDEDGRGALVALTENGWATLRDAAPAHVTSVRRNLIDLLSPAEITTLANIAGKVIDHLQTP